MNFLRFTSFKDINTETEAIINVGGVQKSIPCKLASFYCELGLTKPLLALEIWPPVFN